MQKFFVVYIAPAASMEQWMKTDPEVRKVEEDKMKADWDNWVSEHKEMMSGVTAGLGKTKQVTADGITDTKNDLMMYSIIEATSHEAATDLFKNHPHFQIPGGSIQVMPINFLPGMGE